MAFGISGADNIEIRIQVDSTGAVKVLGETEEKIKGVGKASKQTSSELNDLVGKVVAATVSFKALQGAIETIKAGSRFDDLANSFEMLSAKVGQNAEVLRKDFSDALGGTITKAEEFRRLNELLIAGVKPEVFDDLAKAARSLADATGKEVAPTLDAISEAMIKGNDRALKSLQVQVDLKQAYDDYAASIGTTADRLQEYQQVAAAQGAIIEALNKKQKELGDVTNDAGDNLDVLASSLQNLGLDVARAISQNPQLNKTLTDMVKALKEMDWQPAIEGIRLFTSLVAESIGAVSSLVGWLTDANGLNNGIAILGNYLKTGNMQLAIHKTQLELNAQAARDAAQAEKDHVVALADSVKESLKKKVASEQQAEADRISLELQKMWAEEDKKTIAAEKAKEEAIKKAAQAEEERKKAVVESYKKQQESIKKAFDEAKRLNSSAGIRDTADQVKKIYDNAKSLGLPFSVVVDEVQKLVAELNKAGQSTSNIGVALEAAKNDIAADSKTDDTSFMAQILGDPAKNEQMAKDMAADAALNFAQGFMSTLSTALNGNGEETRAAVDVLIEQTGADLGAAAGEYFGGPLGQIVGQEIGRYVGDMLGDAISSIGEDSEGTKAKKALDKVLSDTFKDFQFSGNQNPLEGLFSQLSPETQAQFTAVGDTLTTFLGQSTDLGVNLGVVLANNNVHLSELAEIVESVGGSFESLANEMLMAFYEGELGVIQLQDQLEELYGIMEGTSTFADLGAAVQSALSADGRVLLNSIKAIGVEAQQLGAVTLPQMADILVNRFGIAASQVQVIMSAMTAAGISSVAQLAEATKLTSTAIAANISQAQQGLTPNNTPVISIASTTPTKSGSNTGGSTRSSSGIDKAASEAKRKAEQQKQAFLRLLNQAQNSAAGRELEKAMKEGAMSDGQYADEIKLLTDAASKAQKALDDAEKNYAATRNKGAEKQKKALEDLLKAQKDLDKVLGVSTGAKSIEVNSGFLSFSEKFASNIQLIEKAAAAAGMKFDDMREKALKAFLSGDKTFSEARQMLDDSGKGVSGKQGAVSDVLTRLLSRGESGGIFSIDDLKGLASEARELGAETLEGLFEGLQGQGASQVNQQALSIALQNAGVTALDQLENINTDVAIKVLDIMKQSGAEFSQTSSELRDIAKQISEIPNSKKVTIELDGSLSPALAAILEKFDMMPEGLGSQQSEQSYDDTALGLRKKHRAEYKRLKSIGKLQKAANYKARYASYF